MKRLNLIIGKKTIIIAGLTFILAIAVWVNFMYSGSLTEPEAEIVGGEAASYGEAEFVSTDSGALENADASAGEAGDTYFAQARLDKAESRDEAKDVLESMYGGGDATSDDLAVIAQSALNLSESIESESKIETLLRAQGFEDALCYISEEGANIIVKTSALDASGAAKIKSTLLSEVDLPAENITIVEVN